MIRPANDSLLTEFSDGILRITFNRPQHLNALNIKLVQALQEIFEHIKTDARIHAVILAGSGGHFMAGGDIKYFQDKLENTPDKQQLAAGFKKLLDDIHHTIITIRTMPQTVIAEVSGAVAGAGFSLMLACDLVVAAETAFFTLAYRHLGVSPDGGSTYGLPRVVGQKRAAEIALLGDRFDAKTALNWGLINRVVGEDELTASARQWAEKISHGPAQALKETKTLLNASLDKDLRRQLDLETETFCKSSQGKEFEEGVHAFMEKRKPDFS